MRIVPWGPPLVVCLSVMAIACPALAKETVLDAFERGAIAPWTFSNGSEFPGATGSLAIGTGLTGNGAHLAYDLSNGGRYVAANLTFSTPLTAAAIGFSARVPAGIRVRLRVVDSGGQTLQYDANRPLEAYEPTKWFKQVVALDAPSSHYGGANDGVIHQPVKALSVLAADPPEPGVSGAIDFDDVIAIDQLSVRVDPRTSEDFPGLGIASLASRLGVNIHFTKDDQALDLAAAGGFTFVRMDLGWSGVEKTKGTYDFSALDGLVASLATRHLGLLLILDYMNPVYPAADASDFGTTTVPAFAAMAKAAAMHFSGKDVRFEIWNEPNLDGFWPPKADAVAYAALAKAAIAAIHSGNATAQVSTAGISSFDFTYLRTYLASGGGDGADAIGVHPYRQNAPESASDEVALLRSIVGTKFPANPPVWSTEWGYSSTWYGDGHSAANRMRQGVFAVRELLTAWALDLPVAVYYDVRDDGTDATNAEHNFGLLANDYSAKPAYTTVKTLTEFAQGGILRGFYDVAPSSLHAARIEEATSADAVIWSDAPGAVIAVTIPAGTTVVGALGGAVPTTAAGADLSITVREADGPVYLSYPTTVVVDAGIDAASGGLPGVGGGGGTASGGASSGGGATSASGGNSAGGTTASTGGNGPIAAGGSNAAGSTSDASTETVTASAHDSSGCGCSVPGSSVPRPAWHAVAIVLLGGLRRRSTPRRRGPAHGQGAVRG